MSQDFKTHYVYISTDFKRIYIGMRSCTGSIEDDYKYMGSYSDPTFNPNFKLIIAKFNTRKEAYDFEYSLIKSQNFSENPLIVNRACYTPTGELQIQSSSQTVKDLWKNGHYSHLSELNKKRWKEGFFDKRRSNSSRMKELWNTEDYRKRVGEAIKSGLKNSEKRKLYISSEKFNHHIKKVSKAFWDGLSESEREDFLERRNDKIRASRALRKEASIIFEIAKRLKCIQYNFQLNTKNKPENIDKPINKMYVTRLRNKVQRLTEDLEKLRNSRGYKLAVSVAQGNNY